MDLRAHTTALLLRGQPTPIVGRLLVGYTRAAQPALLDPDTGSELSREDDRPAFVLSTEGEATDGHIVRQHWDLSRAAAGGPGIPILWGHDPDKLLGQWQDLQRVADLEIGGRALGPSLVARAYLDPEDADAQHRKGQIKRGILNATSMGWIPGEALRRSELDENDPLYRAPMEDDCGQPAEGLVMGTERGPNIAIEGSLVSTPAQATAVVTERLMGGAERAAAQVLSGQAARGGDLDRLMAVVARDPRAQAWLRRLIQTELRALQPAPAPSFFDLLKGR